ncbi:MAG: Unknown protein [uncultured Campylobacterales bacterium]|uniref:Single-stranded DNA-binding protein n=1 Tax=uncultured Campylobacterales bacterium TaxID=352960 RepID=A0A6S6SLK9_9BACT|nr:MAG: Unknown protein [uncultured Campylobacterales bacterium]
MKLIIEGQINSSYKGDDYTDKSTGEVKQGKFYLEIIRTRKLKNGSIKNDNFYMSVPDEKIPMYKDKIGKTVQVECSYYVRDKQVVFMGI